MCLLFIYGGGGYEWLVMVELMGVVLGSLSLN